MSGKEEDIRPLQATKPLQGGEHGTEATSIAHERTWKIFRVLQYNYLLIPLIFVLVHTGISPILFLRRLLQCLTSYRASGADIQHPLTSPMGEHPHGTLERAIDGLSQLVPP
jgi:hypothetical protein